MSTVADRHAIHEKRERAIKFAGTYVKKAVGWIHWDDTRPISSSYFDLLDTLIDEANDIVEALPDDFFEERYIAANAWGMGGDAIRYRRSDDPLEAAEKLVATLRARVRASERTERIAKLENVEGRTEVEAAAFRAKAAELRGTS